MERKKEFSVLSEALLSENTTANIIQVSRCILMERINTVECYDKEISQIVKKLASLYTPQIDVEIQDNQLVKKNTRYFNKEILKNKEVIGYGVAGLLGICLSSCNSQAIDKIAVLGINGARLLGCLLVGGATFAIKNFIDSQNRPIIEKEYKYKIKQTVEDIIRGIDDEFENLKGLLNYNQLEVKYSSILRWIQDLWVESDSEIQKNINKLLAKINYEFIEYDTAFSEYFDSNKANDIDSPMTTRPALRNKKSGDIVERGYVIIPM